MLSPPCGRAQECQGRNSGDSGGQKIASGLGMSAFRVKSKRSGLARRRPLLTGSQRLLACETDYISSASDCTIRARDGWYYAKRAGFEIIEDF